MAAATPNPPKRKGCGPLVLIALVVIVVIAVASNSGGSKTKPAGPFAQTSAQMSAAVSSAVNGDGDSPGVASIQSASCSGGSCSATYTVKTPLGASAALELIDPTRGVFKRAFSDSAVQSVHLTVRGPATSVGGKTSNTAMFSLSCDRSAADQIDWDNVGVNGLKALCTYTPYVGGLNS